MTAIWCALLISLNADPQPLEWEQVSAAAAWQPRDSSGEVVFRDRVWMLGGWFDSFSAPPRDVWSSPDGRQWDRVTAQAPWKFSDLPMTATFRDRMWLMGGWYNGRLPGHGSTSEVWASGDGVEWQQVTTAPWSGRLASGVAVFQDKLWILGGIENYYFGDDTSLKNDVWCSSDGQHWECVTPAAEWSPRAYHQALAYGDRLWILGGGNYVPKYQANNEVWSSRDGKTWERMTASAGWSPRLWFTSAVYRDRMWVLGGWSNEPARNWGDVWSSADGQHWESLPTARCWKERHEHSTFVFQDRLWVVGGHAQPLNSEVWSLSIPPDWFAAKEPQQPN
jgi:hypothetical protein